jgi:hypothetical protein
MTCCRLRRCSPRGWSLGARNPRNQPNVKS